MQIELATTLDFVCETNNDTGFIALPIAPRGAGWMIASRSEVDGATCWRRVRLIGGAA